MRKHLELASPVQPSVQRIDGIPTLESYEIGGNLCANSSLTQSSTSSLNNNTDGALYSNDDRGTSWKFYSPVFTSEGDWKQGFGFTYLLPYPPYQNTTSLVGDPSQASSIPYWLHRGVRMYGLGSDFSLASNQNSDRTFEEAPIVGLCNTSTTISGSTSWRDAGTWTRYDRCQTVTTSSDTITFGAYVRCDPNDALRALNMGGLYLWQDTSASPTGARSIQVNAIVIKRAAHSPSLKTGSIPTGQGHYNWSGLNHSSADGTLGNTSKYRWNDFLTVESLDYYDSEDFSNWTRVEKTVTLQGSGSRQVGLAMYFAENCSYLDGGGELSGSIDFYNPYIIKA